MILRWKEKGGEAISSIEEISDGFSHSYSEIYLSFRFEGHSDW
jgi:hypothetical protein